MLETISDFVTDIRKSKIGRAILQERDAQDRKARQLHVDRIEELRHELAAIPGKYDRRLEQLLEAEDAAVAKARAATQARLSAQRAKENERITLQTQLEREERELLKSADRRIDEAAAAMAARWERERHGVAQSKEIRTGQMDGNTGRRVMRTLDNQRAIKRLLAAMAAARLAFEQLKLANPDDVEGAIDAIVQTVERHWAALGELEGPRVA
jgi:hypothetical protein